MSTYCDGLKLDHDEPRANAAIGGLSHSSYMSLGEVAKVMGITRQRAQQLERSALIKLRMKMAHWINDLK